MPALRPGASLPAELARAAVLDRDGREVVLGDLIGEGPALLVFLRHFGCIGCAQQVAELQPRLAELHQLGMRTILIGNGDAGFIDEFERRHNLAAEDVTIVIDPSLGAFRAAGLRRSIFATLGPRALVGSLRARGRGLRGYRGSGDDLQQGGALVLDGDRRVELYHQNQALADRPDTNDLVEAAMRVLLRSHAGVETGGLV